jgi:hypothetical protein
MRCSYQPIALTSSVRDVIVRVKVRIYDDNSAACSWYCSVAISSFFHLLYQASDKFSLTRKLLSHPDF